MYKKHFNIEKGCKTPFEILEKEMFYVGRMTWVVHSVYSSAEERNKALEELRSK